MECFPGLWIWGVPLKKVTQFRASAMTPLPYLQILTSSGAPESLNQFPASIPTPLHPTLPWGAKETSVLCVLYPDFTLSPCHSALRRPHLPVLRGSPLEKGPGQVLGLQESLPMRHLVPVLSQGPIHRVPAGGLASSPLNHSSLVSSWPNSPNPDSDW